MASRSHSVEVHCLVPGLYLLQLTALSTWPRKYYVIFSVPGLYLLLAAHLDMYSKYDVFFSVLQDNHLKRKIEKQSK